VTTFTIILGILLFSLLILIHELGHFLTAKKFGIRVDEFGMGYPPRLIGFYRDEKTKKWKLILGGDKKEKKKKKKEKPKSTIYSLNLIPFGGFVRIFGQDREDEGSEKEEDSFNSKNVLKRSIVLLAGIIANFVLAIVLLSLVFMIGAPVSTTDIEEQAAGQNEIVRIIDVNPSSPADVAGIRAGDIIETLAFQDSKITIGNIKQVQDFIGEHKGKEIQVMVIRAEEKKNFAVTPRLEFPNNEGPLGVSLVSTVIVKYPWYTSIWKGTVYAFSLLMAIFKGFYLLLRSLIFRGELIAEVAGPVGIFKLTSQAASMGWVYFLHFGAFLSINLAVLNGLPFPALDGGRFLFILIEKIKGSPIKAKTERIVNSVGFGLLILLMIFITARDVIKLFN